VKIIVDDPDQSKFPIGAQRVAAIDGDQVLGPRCAKSQSIREHGWLGSIR
jgi:hypothetical protein